MPNPTSSTNATSAAPVAAPAKVAPVVADTKVTSNVTSKQPAPVAEESWEVEIDGRKEKKSRKELIDAYQLRQVSDKKRSEAEKVNAEYTKLFDTFKRDPIKFMNATGVNFDTLATSYLSKKAEDQMMDPKDRELREARAEAEEYKKYVAEQKAAQEKATKDAEISQSRSAIHKEIVEAIQEQAETLGVPVDEELVIAVAQQMLLQDKAKKPLNAKEALPKAYASTQKWLQGMASKMEGDKLVAWLGNDVAMKIRKHDLAQLKAKRAGTQPQAQHMIKPQAAKKEEAKPYKTWSQFKKESLDTIQ